MSDRPFDEEERMRRFVDRFMSAVPHLNALGIGFHASGPGWAELRMPYAARLVAYPESGVVASGAVFSLMDSACGFSVFVAMGRFEPHATLDLRCDYVRPSTVGADLFGWAHCYKLGRQIAFVRGIAHNGDRDDPVAHVSGTFMQTGAQ